MSDRTVLVIGAGIQGRTAIADLEQSPGVDRIIAADVVAAPVTAFVASIGAKKVEAISLDARDGDAVRDAMRRARVVLSFVPVRIEKELAAAAVDTGVALVTTNYAHQVEPFHERALAAGVTIVAEAGFDPGIDLVIAADAMSQFDHVETLNSYGSGIPAPECKDANLLNYKISWSFEGVLASYWRPARVIVDGVECTAKRDEIFRPVWRHAVKVEHVGELEAFVNGDAVGIVERLGVRDTIRYAGRYTLRWPGHCDFWERIAALGLLDDTTPLRGTSIVPREYLRQLLEPQLQYSSAERDMVILRVDAVGTRNGQRTARRYELVSYREPAGGPLAMSRVVGAPASIVAQMILDGTIRRTGVCSPLRDVPPQAFFDELKSRHIVVSTWAIDPADCYTSSSRGGRASPERV